MPAISIETVVAALLASGKGILAADESFPTIEKRFKALNIPATEGNRRAYREMLFTTPGLNEFISGVILFDETIRQKTNEGVPFAEYLVRQGMIPGIKVDRGTVEFGNSAGEKLTQGLDGLRERLKGYRKSGARFTKWRAVIMIGENVPSPACIEANAKALASFASVSQEAGLIPIVEPEVLMDGNHTIARCEEVTTLTLKTVFAALFDKKIALQEMLLKTGMVLSGTDCPEQADVDVVAEATRRCLSRSVPVAVPGIVFLSGGQNAEDATLRLSAICRAPRLPWKLSFSFGRALQAPAMESWNGCPGNIMAAQEALHLRAQCNSSAIQGRYSVEVENVR
jgi:fructose-bisphosphate aldolase class I